MGPAGLVLRVQIVEGISDLNGTYEQFRLLPAAREARGLGESMDIDPTNAASEPLPTTPNQFPQQLILSLRNQEGHDSHW